MCQPLFTFEIMKSWMVVDSSIGKNRFRFQSLVYIPNNIDDFSSKILKIDCQNKLSAQFGVQRKRKLEILQCEKRYFLAYLCGRYDLIMSNIYSQDSQVCVRLCLCWSIFSENETFVKTCSRCEEGNFITEKAEWLFYGRLTRKRSKIWNWATKNWITFSSYPKVTKFT